MSENNCDIEKVKLTEKIAIVAQNTIKQFLDFLDKHPWSLLALSASVFVWSVGNAISKFKCSL